MMADKTVQRHSEATEHHGEYKDEPSDGSSPSSSACSLNDEQDLEALLSGDGCQEARALDNTSTARTRLMRSWTLRCFVLVILTSIVYGSLAGILGTPGLRDVSNTSQNELELSHEPEAAVQEHGVTIVSGFFLVRQGRHHKVKEYMEWIRNFLENVDQPIYFYTSPDLVDDLRAMRGNKSIIFNTTYTTADDMPPMAAMGGREWSMAMNKLDPQRAEYHYGVYGPWISKAWMVKSVKDVNPYKSEYFFWVDAGGFRSKKTSRALTFVDLQQQVERLYGDHSLPDDTIVLTAPLKWPDGTAFVKALKSYKSPFENYRVNIKWNEYWRCFIQGGFYGGKAAALDWFAEEHMKVVKTQSELGHFTAKEQDTWEHVSRMNWKKVVVMQSFKGKGACGAGWFAYERWASTSKCHMPFWVGPELARQEHQ